MFNKKDPFSNKVKCEECKHWIDKSDAQKVKETTRLFFDPVVTYFYCPLHVRPYDHIFLGSFFKRLEVNEKGEPIGYKKINEKEQSKS